ncbi:amidohydrolase family protein [Helicobacter sp. 13S00477-4]|uniref:amidohydrolase family protein n=1 Tax=Helicobacter sp. 13S00477-4 TaxID=1905759 RepID=UPI000BA78A40|nr:amidohydrolase family protein [Helicobacter sp. 13S00477-4]PAF52267.1 hypothetical protein BKH44_02865 [Helicobacter sp. 13S00477-4]
MLIKNGVICDHSQNKKADIRIQDKKIVQIAPQLTPLKNEKQINCDGKIITPALIDLNVYPKSKILSQSSLITLSKKCLKGGVGTILLLPDTTPACENIAIIELIKIIDTKTEITLLPSIKPTNNENKLNDISILHSQGGKVIYIDSHIDGNNLLRIAQYSSMLNIPLICFAQDPELASGVINEGELASTLGLPSISPLSQTKEIAKFSQTARHLNVKILFNTITEIHSFEIINDFKSKHTPIFTQTPIHHLILDESSCKHYNTRAKLNPPLKDTPSKAFLLKSLKENKIDMLTSLQCADYNSKKDLVFELASFGVDSIAHYFALAYTYLIKPGHITLEHFLRIASKNQSDFLSLQKGEIALDKDADLMIIDPNDYTHITDTFSPYHDQKLNSKIQAMIINGDFYE